MQALFEGGGLGWFIPQQWGFIILHHGRVDELASCISIFCWLFSLLQCVRHSSRVINLYHQILTFHPKTKHYWARCAKNMKMPALLLPPSTTLYYISLYLEWEIINTGLFTKFGDSQKISHNLVKICPLYPSLKKSPKMLIENSPNLLKKSSQYSS